MLVGSLHFNNKNITNYHYCFYVKSDQNSKSTVTIQKNKHPQDWPMNESLHCPSSLIGIPADTLTSDTHIRYCPGCFSTSQLKPVSCHYFFRSAMKIWHLRFEICSTGSLQPFHTTSTGGAIQYETEHSIEHAILANPWGKKIERGKQQIWIAIVERNSAAGLFVEAWKKAEYLIGLSHCCTKLSKKRGLKRQIFRFLVAGLGDER